MKTRHILGLLMVLAASCQSKDETMIVVEVWSEMGGIDAVRVDVTGPTASTSKTFPLVLPTNPWPVRLALVPEDARDAILTVRATGLFNKNEIMRRAARVAFVPGKSKLLKLVLEGLCANVSCGPSQSCSAGACVPVPTIPNLPDYNPKPSTPATGGMGGAPTVAGNSGRSGGVIGIGGTIIPIGGTVQMGGTSSTSVRTGGSLSTGGTAGRPNTGGTSSPGGSSGSGGTCAVGKACGGDVVGTWNVTSSCLQYSGNADISYLGLTCVPNTAKITGSVSVTGTLILDANGRYTDKTVTTGSESWVLDPSCLNLSGTRVTCNSIGTFFAGSLSTFGYEDFQCVNAANGGCNCQGKINQAGGMGVLHNDLYTTGGYKVNGSTLTLGDAPRYSYCVNGTTMNAVPIPEIGTPYTGTIVLQKSCTGTGCTGGSGGNGGTGGNSGGSVSSGGSKSSGGSTSTDLPPAPAFTGIPLPCEVVAKDGGGGKCVTAHSTVRAIVSGYSGPLYQLCKGGSSPGPGSCKGTTQDILAKDGYADVDAHDAFCGEESCTITKIYDQAGMGNDLEPAPKGGAKATPDNPAKASALPIVINGRKAYGLLIKAGMGYRTGCTGCTIKKGNGMALGDEPQTVYMVSSQKDLIDGCCFDYGNAETTSNDDGNGAAEAVYFGAGVVWGTGYGGKPGPWVMADLENGVYAGWENKQDKNISTNKPLKFDFVTAVMVGDTMEKNNGQGRFALYGGDAQGTDPTLGKLTCMYDGIRPEKKGYVPMQKQGSLILGAGSDNSSGGGGRFFEGATITGPLVSKTTLSFLHAVIVAAKYQNAN